MTDMTQDLRNLQTTAFSRILTLDWEKIAYIALIIAAVITRFYDVGSRVVSHDESLHTQYSYQFYSGDGFSHTPLMHGPFLFHITAASYWLFGDSDFTARLPVALFGVLLVVLPYFVRDWIGKKGALFASFVFLISPYVTYYSRYIRHDVYVIVFAMICFISTLYYLRDRDKEDVNSDKYLWWFAGGLAMMYCTKEVSFIYTAIFGSFLVIRLLARMIPTKSFRESWTNMLIPLGVIGLGVLFVGVSRITGSGEDIALNIPALVGWFVIGGGLFFAIIKMRSELDHYPEFDLILLYATLLLPSLSAYLSRKAGVDPLNYNLANCNVEGIQFFSPTCWSTWFGSPIFTTSIFVIILLAAGITVGLWWNVRKWLIAAVIFHVLFAFFYTSVFTNIEGWSSGTVGSLGYWLDQQAVERGNQPWFYYLFAMPFYEFMPVIFSYAAMRLWLTKQKLNRYVGYIVTTLFLTALAAHFTHWLYTRSKPGTPLSLAVTLLLGIIILNWVLFKIWRMRVRPNGWTGPVEGLLTIAALTSFIVLLAARPIYNQVEQNGVFVPRPIVTTIGGSDETVTTEEETTDEHHAEEPLDITQGHVRGGIIGLVVLASGVAYWFLIRRKTVNELEEGVTWAKRLDADELTGFVPHAVWWLLLTYVFYTWAGEKMPWLSIHFVIPMALLIGWYFQQKLEDVSWNDFKSHNGLILTGLSVVIFTVGFLALKTMLVDIRFGDQSALNLTNTGELIGRLAVFGGLLGLFIWLVRDENRVPSGTIQRAWLFGIFIALSALTIRSTYLSSFVHPDSTREFIGYAHGNAPTKEQVMRQVEEISMRLHGDLSVDVRFDDDTSWPMHWYLRNYPNNRFLGGSPGADIVNAPVLVIGNDNWTEVDAIVRDDFEHETYTYLWWPMEQYRDFGWDAFLGTKGDNRGLDDPDVREAMWDIFFHREYDKYGEVFGGTYDEGEWPLRDELRIYIKRDVLAKLWDSGIAGTLYAPPVQLYSEGDIDYTPLQTFGNGSTLNKPRNVAVGADGRVYVADSDNHRIQVFNPDGSVSNTFGQKGEEGSPGGNFNQPWGLAVSDAFVYVADTWNHRVQKFTLDGEFVQIIGSGGGPSDTSEGELRFFGPRDIAFDAEGNLLVTDTGNSRIQHISPDGEYLGSFGESGVAIGQFSEPTGVSVASDGSIYVAEAWSRRVQRWTSKLNPVNSIEIDSWEGQSLANKPYITVDNGDRIIISDPEGYRLLVFNTAGDYLGRLGTFGTDATAFDLPTGLTTDAEGNIYVADTNNNRVLKLPALTVTEPITVEQ